jgi:hypothetical protein
MIVDTGSRATNNCIISFNSTEGIAFDIASEKSFDDFLQLISDIIFPMKLGFIKNIDVLFS